MFRVREAAHVINGKALSKACIHKENELKTCPMKLRQYIYKEFGSYWNIQGDPCRCIQNESEDDRNNWNTIETGRK